MPGSFSSSELPHKPGSQMATRLSPLARNTVEDNYSANIVGQNNVTGRPIVATEGSNQTVETVSDGGDYRVGETVDVSRDRSSERSGSRRAGSKRYSATLGGGSSDSQPSENAGFSTPDTTGCSTRFSISVTRNEPPPPEPPPEVPPPSPNNPEPGDEQETTPDQGLPDGCDPQSSSQWYNSPDGEPTSCPAGTNYLGFAQLGENSFMVLCEGANRPSGDGCPTSPTGNGQSQQGYSCIGGVCTQIPGGQYATLAECQASGCSRQSYVCLGGTCTLVAEVADGSSYFETLELCQASGCGARWECVSGTCIQQVGGSYASESECLETGCEIPSQRVRVNMTWEQNEVDIFSPSCTPVWVPRNVTWGSSFNQGFRAPVSVSSPTFRTSGSNPGDSGIWEVTISYAGLGTGTTPGSEVFTLFVSQSSGAPGSCTPIPDSVAAYLRNFDSSVIPF